MTHISLFAEDRTMRAEKEVQQVKIPKTSDEEIKKIHHDKNEQIPEKKLCSHEKEIGKDAGW